MIYGDEEIIRARVAAQAKKQHTIENEVTIDNVKYTFARREFEFGFSMVAPEQFEVMPEETARRKFPYEDRPVIIISSGNTRVCLAFDEDEPQKVSLEDRLRSYKDFNKKLHPSDVFFSKTIIETKHGLRIAYYDYRYIVIDNDIYNINFFMDLPEKELFGHFICPIDFMEKWEPLVVQMIKSIEIGGNKSGE